MAAPFIAYFLLGSTVALFVVVFSQSKSLRGSALLCSSLMLSLAVVEAGMYYVEKSEIIVTETTPERWRESVMDLGLLPIPNSATEFREFLDGRLIGDVTYRIDGSGLRGIPAAVQGGPHKVAFFGCSFMFGHGVENDQTLPYYFVQESGGTLEGFNFAGEGWGPHQTLREIENGFVKRVAGAPELAIYEAIPDHLRRLAGRAPWEDGPRYDSCQGGDACYSGPFHSVYYETSHRWLERSWIVKFFENHFDRLSRPSDIPLFLVVMNKIRTLLQNNGTRFVIVVWDQNDLGKIMMKALRSNRFEVVALSSIFPEGDLEEHPLTQIDRHPSPTTNKAIAAYLWKQVGEQSLNAVHAR